MKLYYDCQSKTIKRFTSKQWKLWNENQYWGQRKRNKNIFLNLFYFSEFLFSSFFVVHTLLLQVIRSFRDGAYLCQIPLEESTLETSGIIVVYSSLILTWKCHWIVFEIGLMCVFKSCRKGHAQNPISKITTKIPILDSKTFSADNLRLCESLHFGTQILLSVAFMKQTKAQ